MGLTYITTDDSAAQAAARWLRNQIRLPEYTSIIPHFEKEFNCSIEYLGDFSPTKIYFKTEQDLMWFLLKWS